jgi:nucleoside-diphosphate kinase
MFMYMKANEELLKKHYADLSSRPFFPGLIEYMQLGPVVPMVWEGLNVVKTGRQLLGETNPADSKPGTIRGDFCIQTGRYLSLYEKYIDIS